MEETERGSYLAYIRADTSVAPNLAKLRSRAPDFLSLTISLREGAQWSDGQPFTADDIVFAFEDWHFDLGWVNGGTQPFQGAACHNKIDDYTVRLDDSHVPYPVMLAMGGSRRAATGTRLPAQALPGGSSTSSTTRTPTRSPHPSWATIAGTWPSKLTTGSTRTATAT